MKWTVLAITSVLVTAALGAACAGPTSDESTNEAIAAAAAPSKPPTRRAWIELVNRFSCSTIYIRQRWC